MEIGMYDILPKIPPYQSYPAVVYKLRRCFGDKSGSSERKYKVLPNALMPCFCFYAIDQTLMKCLQLMLL